MSLYDDMAFWRQIEGDAKRTVLCEPDQAEAVRVAVEERGYGHLITVLASPCCPEGQMIVIDEAAMEASQRQSFQRAGKNIMHPWRQ